MEKDLNSEEELNLQLLADFFTKMFRQGPGDSKETLKALSFVETPSQEIKIADIGCGTGAQTLVLAKNTKSRITAVDLLPEMIEGMNKRIKFQGFEKRVKGIVAPMENLPFVSEEFDLIWAEGSIYNIGFQKGLKEWKEYLKPGGTIAVTELSWFTNNRPQEIDNYITSCYSEIDTISNKVTQMEMEGYLPISHFILPEICWTENYYDPIIDCMGPFLVRHHYSEASRKIVCSLKEEIDYYKKYKDYYGYVFYIGKKII